MSSVVISGNTSGAVTLTVPDVAGTNTATLPASTGTVMVSGNMPAFSAYLNNDIQNISSSTYTKAQLNTELFDTNNCFDSTTNYRFTPTVAGYYQISAGLRVVATNASNNILSIYKNGSGLYSSDTFGGSTGNLSQYFNIMVPVLVYFNGSTDYLELYGYTNGSSASFRGGNGGTGVPPWNTFLTGVLVRAA